MLLFSSCSRRRSKPIQRCGRDLFRAFSTGENLVVDHSVCRSGRWRISHLFRVCLDWDTMWSRPASRWSVCPTRRSRSPTWRKSFSSIHPKMPNTSWPRYFKTRWKKYHSFLKTLSSLIYSRLFVMEWSKPPSTMNRATSNHVNWRIFTPHVNRWMPFINASNSVWKFITKQWRQCAIHLRNTTKI